jgi:hypothetical protein
VGFTTAPCSNLAKRNLQHIKKGYPGRTHPRPGPRVGAVARDLRHQCHRLGDFPSSMCYRLSSSARVPSSGASRRAVGAATARPVSARMPRDRDGHGTHIASTAVGTVVADASGAHDAPRGARASWRTRCAGGRGASAPTIDKLLLAENIFMLVYSATHAAKPIVAGMTIDQAVGYGAYARLRYGSGRAVEASR